MIRDVLLFSGAVDLYLTSGRKSKSPYSGLDYKASGFLAGTVGSFFLVIVFDVRDVWAGRLPVDFVFSIIHL